MKDSIKARALHLPEEGDDDDEDEETLQLRLQALEAKLKLKKLRQKKNKDAANSSDAENERPSKSTAPTRSNGTGRPDEKERVILGKAFSSASVARPVQVPASPPRKHTATEPPKSPGRVLLGIDKGLKGKNVSLRRPPVMKNGHQDLDDPFLEDTLRHKGTSQQSTSYLSSSRQQGSMPKPKGFSERIASIRQHDKDQTERVKKLQAQKSTGFGLVKEELERMKTVAEEEARLKVASRERSSAKPVFSRDEVLKAAKQPNGGLIHRSNPDDKVVTRRKGYNNPNASPGFVKPSKPREKAPSASPPPAKASSTINKKSTSTDDSLFEPFSSLHLSKRLIPHDSLTKALSGKSILLLPDVLGTVKAPEYCWGDDLEADVVVLATIASKSNPLSHKDAHKTVDKASTDEPKSSLTEAAESETNVRGKYLALTLTDLKWTLDLYLFTTAFTRFRKLTPGTVVAILNPSIMPPPPHNPHNNRFSLTLSSSDDTILEIGTSRDLNWCSAVKKDGKHCGDWIDKRHTSVCEFHVDRVLERTRRGRMEVNGMSVPFAPGGKKGGRTGFWGGGKGKINSREANTKSYEDRGGRGGGANVVRDGRQYDRFNKTTYYVGGPAPAGVFGQSAASLLDGDALNERGGREERMRKRLAEREREKEIARSLGERGNGMGGEYLKIRHENPSSEHGVTMAVQGATTGREEVREPMDAKALGLKGNKGADVLLSPLKKRRRVKDGMEDGPRRKKTRFVTEGGIKEAGRESLGVVGGERYDGAEDNDELDIV
ncbi:MAG: hypothetical protein L6R40_001834 [Gallowayella cf. fulva]|nr:MAG: hypothetical protein L6R40_001834 [Xanthomendoza cf. fulva]